ncbi:MAG: hypothetical protein IJZ93_02805 [Clostridia bacterium]|nr:hypothetical protein [Clostridia bacterium]
MKKTILTVAIIISIFCFNSCSLLDGGCLYIGDGWQDTPELALVQAANGTAETEQMLTVKHLLETRYIDDIAIMTFVSKGDTLVTATFVTNDEGKYHYHGCTEEGLLSDPTEFVLNGDSEQFVLFPYQQYNSKVFGWCYSSASFTVNGKTPSKEAHSFACQGKEWTLDFWYLNDVPPNTEISIAYINN